VRIINLVILAFKFIIRHPVRSLLTVLGISTGMFPYIGVETMQAGLRASTKLSDTDSELIVYRKDRFCPFTSKMPEHYVGRMKKVPGVTAVMPVKVLVNSCGTSLDIIVLRGIREEDLSEFEKSFEVIAGNRDDWFQRQDAVIVGDMLARRRKLKVGDLFASSGINVYVAAIMSSRDHQYKNSAFAHKEFLQKASKDGLGIITQFVVKVKNPADLRKTARAIDEEFRNEAEPTYTRIKQEFVAKTAGELIRMISFTRWVGLAAVLAVLGLVANTISMAVRGRIRDNAILQTMGYNSLEIIILVVAEGMILGWLGGLIAIGSALTVLHFGNFCLTSEGASIVFFPDSAVFLAGGGISLILGLLAGVLPAYRASRQNIVLSLRMGC